MPERLIVANWKMHKVRAEARAWVQRLVPKVAGRADVTTVVCPSFPLLDTVRAAIGDAPVRLGAQTMHWEEQGAFTGEVSARQLVDAGCSYVILGHSERRALVGESDQEVGRKIRAALEAGLVPIYCVGESLEDHDRRHTRTVLRRQYGVAFRGLSAAEVARVVVAYEPVWAIGTGRAATPAEAAEAAGFIRSGVAELYGPQVAEAIAILYGGSVSPANVAGFWAAPGIQGCLVGGASLDADTFAALYP